MEHDKDKKVALPVIKRLPRYYRYLGDLLDAKIYRISSKELSRRMKLTASQIRQDLNNFGCFGQQGYGYNVELLYREIGKILALDKTYKLVIIGAGNIGQALANYMNFERRGFHFVGMFDIDPKVVGTTIRDIKVYHIDTLSEFLKKYPVDIAVLTLPRTSALKVAETVIQEGVKGIWNFSHVDIEIPHGVVVENVHLTDSLMTLSYKLREEQIIENFMKEERE